MYINRHDDVNIGGDHCDRANYHVHRYSPEHFDTNASHENYYTPKKHTNRHVNYFEE
jgi:hypothetical protein